MLDVSQVTNLIGDFQREYLYKLQIISYPTKINELLPNAAKIAENIDYVALSTPIPDQKTADIKLKWGGMYGHWSGVNESSGEVSWTFRLPASHGALNFFETWRNLTGDPETGVALSKPQTLGSIKIAMVDIDKTTILKAYLLSNLTIHNIDQIELKKDGSEIMTFKVTARFEKRKMITENLGNV